MKLASTTFPTSTTVPTSTTAPTSTAAPTLTTTTALAIVTTATTTAIATISIKSIAVLIKVKLLWQDESLLTKKLKVFANLGISRTSNLRFKKLTYN